MEEDTDSSANIEWKQDKKPSKNTRLSRRLDIKKVVMSEEKSNRLDVGANRIKNNTQNLKKIRSKIKEVFDDDEDEEEQQVLFFNFENENNESSLLNALKEEERQKIQVAQTIKNQDMQQTVGKMEAITEAGKQLRRAGLKNIDAKTVNENMIKVATDNTTLDNTLQQHLEKREKINLKKIASLEDTQTLMSGIRKLKQAQLQNPNILEMKDIRKIEADELIELGKEKDEKTAAEKIIDMTGRKPTKQKSKEEVKEAKKVTQRQVIETLKQQDKISKRERD